MGGVAVSYFNQISKSLPLECLCPQNEIHCFKQEPTEVTSLDSASGHHHRQGYQVGGTPAAREQPPGGELPGLLTPNGEVSEIWK